MQALDTTRASENPDTSLDDLINQKGRILKTKLEVFASEIHERVRIRSRNIDRISEDEETVKKMLKELNRMERYRLRDTGQQQRTLYQEVFTLEKERREQDVECWRDVVQVMRDFLDTWEAHQQAKSKADLFKY